MCAFSFKLPETPLGRRIIRMCELEICISNSEPLRSGQEAGAWEIRGQELPESCSWKWQEWPGQKSAFALLFLDFIGITGPKAIAVSKQDSVCSSSCNKL